MPSYPQSPVWHPFTQHGLDPITTRIVRTEGAYLIDEHGHPVLDAISSWWVITHRHRHPAIAEAIQVAAEIFDQIIFAEYTHEAAEELAKGLLQVAPPGLAHVFYSDSGSTSVEVALKMALGFFHHAGDPRSRIVCFNRFESPSQCPRDLCSLTSFQRRKFFGIVRNQASKSLE